MENTRVMKHTGDETHARAVKSHQPSGLAWFRVVLISVFIPSSFQPFGFRPSGERFTPPLLPPQGPGPVVFIVVAAACCDFFAIWALSFFPLFLSMPFLIDLGSILPPNLAPQIHQFSCRNHWIHDNARPQLSPHAACYSLLSRKTEFAASANEPSRETSPLARPN